MLQITTVHRNHSNITTAAEYTYISHIDSHNGPIGLVSLSDSNILIHRDDPPPWTLNL